MACPADRHRRRARPRRLGQHRAGDGGDARAADRRAEADGLDRRLRQRRALCRAHRHRDDVLRRRRRRHQLHQPPRPRQRGARGGRHGAHRAARGILRGKTRPRPQHVRRHHALRDDAARGAGADA